ncbi:MAG: VCBS domain-containing protein, partial [Hyphomicrobiales bacterium]
MARSRFRLSGDFKGAVQEELLLVDNGVVRVKNATRKPKANESFTSTDDPAGTPVGNLTAKVKGKNKIIWTYTLDNDDPRVQALAAGETITESYKLTVKVRGAKTVKKTIKVVINGENDDPDITSDGGDANAAINIDENTKAVTT